MLQAVIFDMDGLLIDSEPLWQDAEIEIFGEVNITLTRALCKQTMGVRIDEVVEYWYRQYPWSGPDKKQIEERIIAKVIELVRTKGQPKAGVEYALDFFASKGVKLALASSSSYAIIQAVLEKFHIRNMFSTIYSAEEEPYGKPHPGVYITTAKKLEVPAWECLALEDSLNGVIAAKAARMKCIAIPEEFPNYDPKFIVADVVLPSLEAIQPDTWEAVNPL